MFLENGEFHSCALKRKRLVQMKSTEKRCSHNIESSLFCCSLISLVGVVKLSGNT